jgi:hypothetical protein
VLTDDHAAIEPNRLDAAAAILRDPTIGLVALLGPDAAGQRSAPVTAVVLRAEIERASGGIDAGFFGAEAALVDLSVRLWRLGYTCASLPPSPSAEPVAVDAGGADGGDGLDERYLRLLDQLRLAAIHLDADRRAELLRGLRGEAMVAAAFAEVVRGDAGRRRAELDRTDIRSAESWPRWTAGAGWAVMA